MIASLDLLILSLVEGGIDTPYRWQTQAGLSLGATLPAAQRFACQAICERAQAWAEGAARVQDNPHRPQRTQED
jgi:hypothetical protein